MITKLYLTLPIIVLYLLWNITYVNASIPGFACHLKWVHIGNNKIENKDCFDIVNFKIRDNQKIFKLQWVTINNKVCFDKIKKEVSWVINFEDITSYNLQPEKEYSLKIIQEHLNSNLPETLVTGYSTNKNNYEDLPTCNISYKVNDSNINYFYYIWILFFIITFWLWKLYFLKK